MAKFRKKQVVIDAVQFHADDITTQRDVNFGVPKNEGDGPHPLDGKYWVREQHGPMIVSEGDWILTAISGPCFAPPGEHWVCGADIFAATYEPAE